MPVIYEKLVKQDLNLGHGTTFVTQPDGGTALGDKVGVHTFIPGEYNVKDFGAIGDGLTDDTSAIQAALTTARLAGGGTVILPAGTYLITTAQHPNDDGPNNWQVGLMVGANTILRGVGRDQSIIKLAAGSAGPGSAIMNYQIGSAGGDEAISFLDFTVDGNAANQSGMHYGIHIIRGRSVTHTRVRVMNMHGTSGAGDLNETFHFDYNRSGDGLYVDCEVIGSSGSTATGFSANGSTNVVWANCLARGMSVHAGFTHWTCRHVVYLGCRAFLNANMQFNSEESDDVAYIGCTAGGTAAVPGAESPAWPYSDGQNLGATGKNGFVINGTDDAVLVGCIARAFTDATFGYGLFLGGNAALGVRVTNCIFADNRYGIGVAGGLATTAQNLRCHGVIFDNNSVFNMEIPAGFNTGFGYAGAANPAVPASTTALTNPLGFDADVVVTGGTVSAVAIGGEATGLTSGWFPVPAGQTITLTYTVAPTWKWFQRG